MKVYALSCFPPPYSRINIFSTLAITVAKRFSRLAAFQYCKCCLQFVVLTRSARTSSNRRTFGLRRNAWAMAMRCKGQTRQRGWKAS
jgi:hypothetical protein